MKSLFSVFACVALIASCKLTSPVPVEPDYPDGAVGAGTCEAACKRLSSLGCPEGGASCVAGCKAGSSLRNLPLACWANAKTQDEAKACGALRCTP